MTIRHVVQYMQNIKEECPTHGPDYMVVNLPTAYSADVHWILYGIGEDCFVHHIRLDGNAIMIVITIPKNRGTQFPHSNNTQLPRSCSQEIAMRLDYVRQAFERQRSLKAWSVREDIAVLWLPTFLGGREMIISRYEYEQKLADALVGKEIYDNVL